MRKITLSDTPVHFGAELGFSIDLPKYVFSDSTRSNDFITDYCAIALIRQAIQKKHRVSISLPAIVNKPKKSPGKEKQGLVLQSRLPNIGYWTQLERGYSSLSPQSRAKAVGINGGINFP